MKVKYNRVSTLQQTGLRFTDDKEKYDLVLMDKVSGSISFKERPQAKRLVKLVDDDKVTDLIVEEFSRLGRNTGDVISTLDWLESKEINVTIRNLGLQSRPDGIRNPIWKMISSVMSSLYEMELQNIKERTTVGRMVYVQNGGKLGRPNGSHESDLKFLQKQSSLIIAKSLKKGFTVREVSKVANTSTKTVMKVKRLIISCNRTNIGCHKNNS
ncbi:MAG TPA: recombinase family protein [Pedobacter sp.]|jgi:DNA invertase Pin-like site-specific DNA recombinase